MAETSNQPKLWTIHRANGQDSEAAVDVVKQVYDEYGFGWFPETYHADLYDLDAAYIQKQYPFWIARLADGTPIGTVSLEWIHPPIPGDFGIQIQDGYERIAGADCALNRLYVSPKARRLGVGRALTLAVMEEARLNKKKRLELWSDKRFDKAHQLYQSLGGKIVGDRICHDPEQSPEWGLCIDL